MCVFPFQTHFLTPLLQCLRYCSCSCLWVLSTTFYPACHNSVFCMPRLMFGSCILSSYQTHLSTFSLAQGGKAIRLMELVRLAGRYRLREEIVSGPSRTYGAIASCPIILLTGLDTQIKYISHTTFYPEMTSSSNLSALTEMFTACAMNLVSTESLREGPVSLVSIGLVRKLVSMRWRSITLASLLRTSLLNAAIYSRSRLYCFWLGSWWVHSTSET